MDYRESMSRLLTLIDLERNMGAAAQAGQPLVLHNPKSQATTALAQLATKLIQ